MIKLTRLKHDDVLFLNPDLIERIDTHVDTVVRLTNGSEYVVNEPGDEIIGRIAEFRARVLALVPIVSLDLPAPGDADDANGSDGGADRRSTPIAEVPAR